MPALAVAWPRVRARRRWPPARVWFQFTLVALTLLLVAYNVGCIALDRHGWVRDGVGVALASVLFCLERLDLLDVLRKWRLGHRLRPVERWEWVLLMVWGNWLLASCVALVIGA